jgi:short chain dehydrogenase
MINNAGLMPQALLERLQVDEWERMIDVNLNRVLYGIAPALPIMKQQNSGHLINVSSPSPSPSCSPCDTRCITLDAIRQTRFPGEAPTSHPCRPRSRNAPSAINLLCTGLDRTVSFPCMLGLWPGAKTQIKNHDSHGDRYPIKRNGGGGPFRIPGCARPGELPTRLLLPAVAARCRFQDTRV